MSCTGVNDDAGALTTGAFAGRDGAPRVIPAAAKKPRISCTIGEQMWQRRWGGMDFR